MNDYIVGDDFEGNTSKTKANNKTQVLSNDTCRLISSVITFLNNKDMEAIMLRNAKNQNER